MTTLSTILVRLEVQFKDEVKFVSSFIETPDVLLDDDWEEFEEGLTWVEEAFENACLPEYITIDDIMSAELVG